MSTEATTLRPFCPVSIICNSDFEDRITQEMLDWLNTRSGRTYVRLENGGIRNEADTFVCPCCDSREERPAFSVFTDMGRRESWCEHCRENDAYYWEGDGRYHTSSEPEEDEECDSSEDDVAGYHSLRRPWDHRTPPPLTIGVELETWANNACDHAHLAMRLGLLAERDGSLCSEHGVEIIGKPMLMAEYSSPSSPWRKLFEASAKTFKAWDAGSGYGMHVNLNRTGLNSLHQAKIICFIHGHRAFCEQVAGRTEAQATSAGGTKWTEYTQKRIGRCKENGKYEAASMREGRIEVRIFRATRKWESFMKNVEFCDAVRAYCGERVLVDINLPGFLSYVGAQPGRWPNFNDWLEARMSKERAARHRPVPAAFALATMNNGGQI